MGILNLFWLLLGARDDPIRGLTRATGFVAALNLLIGLIAWKTADPASAADGRASFLIQLVEAFVLAGLAFGIHRENKICAALVALLFTCNAVASFSGGGSLLGPLYSIVIMIIGWQGTYEIFRLSALDEVAEKRRAEIEGAEAEKKPMWPAPKPLPTEEAPAPEAVYRKITPRAIEPSPAVAAHAASPVARPPRIAVSHAPPAAAPPELAPVAAPAAPPPRPVRTSTLAAAARAPIERLKPTAGDAVLLTYPVAGALAAPQLEAASSALELPREAVPAAFAGPLSRVTTLGPADKLARIAAKLEEVELPCLTIAADALVGNLRPFVVRELGGDETGQNLMVTGPSGDAKLPRDQAALVVLGPRDDAAEKRFLHLYYAASERPYEFREEDIARFQLGDAGAQGFDLLVKALSANPGSVVNDMLVKHHPLARDAAIAALGTAATKAQAAALLSRAIFFTWIS